MCLDLPSIYFEFNEASLRSDGQESLDKIAECFKNKGGRITVEGHCDERGTIEYNLALGDRRARAVRKYLARLGVDASRLDIVSKGELEPADPGHNEEAWAKNRRAEFIER
jgi:peptidoglycan-associated lipoprotein